MNPVLTIGDAQVYEGHVLDVLRTLPDNSVQCCVTSIPYYGLRSYGTPKQVWGGASDCRHKWSAMHSSKDSYAAGAKRRWQHDKGNGTHTREAIASDRQTLTPQGDFCSICGAWRGELGLEPHPSLFIDHIVEIFEEVRRVTKKDGTCWVNVGDSYSNQGKWGGSGGSKNYTSKAGGCSRAKRETGVKEKDLLGMPWEIAFALRDAGWHLRRDIIWHKPNPMPESVIDRPTTAHEYVFLLSKSPRYYYDKNAIQELVAGTAHHRGDGVNSKATYKTPDGWDTGKGSHGAAHKDGREKGKTGYQAKTKSADRDAQGLRVSTRLGREPGWRNRIANEAQAILKEGKNEQSVDHRKHGLNARWDATEKDQKLKEASLDLTGDVPPKRKTPAGANSHLHKNHSPSHTQPQSRQNESFSAAICGLVTTRNARSVWTIATQPFKKAHFATFPKELPSRCIRAGSRPGDIVLDPFAGSGTSGEVALELGRKVILIELQSDYLPMIESRLRSVTPPLPLEVAS